MVVNLTPQGYWYFWDAMSMRPPWHQPRLPRWVLMGRPKRRRHGA